MNLGIFVSAFARNELQIVQFIPLVIVPQVLLGGLFFPVQTLPVVLKQAGHMSAVDLRQLRPAGRDAQRAWR